MRKFVQVFPNTWYSKMYNIICNHAEKQAGKEKNFKLMN